MTTTAQSSETRIWTSSPISLAVVTALSIGSLSACGDMGRSSGKKGDPETKPAPQETALPDTSQQQSSESPTPGVRVTTAEDLPASTPIEDEWARQRWIDKAARTLRNGAGIAAGEDLDAMLARNREEVIAEFMNDPRFLETVSTFGLHFLGYGPKPLLQNGGRVNTELLQFPQVITATRELAVGGDYLKLFSLEQPGWAAQLGMPFLPNPDDGNDDNSATPAPTDPTPQPTPAEIRAIVLAQLLAKVDETIAFLSTENPSREEFCSDDDQDDSPSSLLFRLGLPNGMEGRLFNQWFLPEAFYCFLNLDGSPSDFKNNYVMFRAMLPRLMDAMTPLDPEVYKPQTVVDLRALDEQSIGLTPSTQLTERFWENLPNSSTSFNRKRGAYVLKRFFCDDLTPITIAVPDQHISNQHGNSASCMSCHYKLDPMSGFFKNHGINGTSFGGQPRLLFDDLAMADKATYDASWQFADGTAPAGVNWNIGVVRSLEDPRLNSWGESPQDLFHIIRTAPEARQCLVRRAVEFFGSSSQAIDAGWLAWLTENFNRESATEASPTANSSMAFKRLVARIVTSNLFSASDPNSNQCYDYAPGANPAGRPPCRVAHVLERNCASCHGPRLAAGGLDVTAWVELEGGAKSFRHTKSGQQLTKRASFESIIDRLETSDRMRRMPLDMHISPADREVLDLWVRDTLTRGE